MKLLFTGASGFLGNNIIPQLYRMYDVVHTLGLAEDEDIKFNLSGGMPPLNTHYDVVLHACGKAHSVPRTEAERKVFYDVNFTGTVNLCKALETAGIPHPPERIPLSRHIHSCIKGAARVIFVNRHVNA